MSYMDQGMPCKICGREHSQFSTGICFSCQWKERHEKAEAEWAAKTSAEKALYHLESWANPQHMTFNRHDAKFVLGVVRDLIASQAAPLPKPDISKDTQWLPAVGEDVLIRHGRDNDDHLCTVTGYEVWPALKSKGGEPDPFNHRVLVHVVYKGTTHANARHLHELRPAPKE